MFSTKTATFIGHSDCFGVSESQIKEAIREFVNQGVTDFMNGGQGGFDRTSAKCVYELKKSIPKSKIISLSLICLSMFSIWIILTLLFTRKDLKSITSKLLYLQEIGSWWTIQAMRYVMSITDGAELQKPLREQR